MIKEGAGGGVAVVMTASIRDDFDPDNDFKDLYSNKYDNDYNDLDTDKNIIQTNLDSKAVLATEYLINSTSPITQTLFLANEYLYSQQPTQQQPSVLNSTIVSAFNINITGKEILSLTSTGGRESWLNDNIIDFYFNLLSNKGFNKHLNQSINVISSLEFTRYAKNIQAISDLIIKHNNIFDFDLSIIPICIYDHWSMVLINTKDKKVRFYDSNIKLKTNKERKDSIKAFVIHIINKDSTDKKIIFNICDWIFRAQSSLPQQSNTNDCGVYICSYAKHISLKQEISDNINISNLRTNIKNEIIQCEISDFNSSLNNELI